jgi:hypothetical protein
MAASYAFDQSLPSWEFPRVTVCALAEEQQRIVSAPFDLILDWEGLFQVVAQVEDENPCALSVSRRSQP